MERHAGEQPPLGIEDLPPVPGRADHLDPEFAVGGDEDLADEGLPVRPAGAAWFAGGVRPVPAELLEFLIAGGPFFVRDGLNRQ